VLRALQGIGVGGEWGGSILISMEWARGNNSRGLVASWPQFGVPAGLFLANLAVLGFSAYSGAEFNSWGWRIPFFLSAVLIAFGLWIRLGILETPVFRNLVETKRIERAPALEAIRRQPRQIILSALVRMAEQSPFYIFTTFVFAYATTTLHLSRNLVLSAVLVAAAGEFIAIPLFGHVSDLIGRRKMFLFGSVFTGFFGLLYFWLLSTGNVALIFLAIAISLIPHGMLYGPLAALIAEAFTPRLRYSGSSLGYQFASVIAGGPAPLIATALIARYHSGFAIAGYIGICAVISVIAASLMPDYTGKDISAEYDE
jgi:MFS family permease